MPANPRPLTGWVSTHLCGFTRPQEVASGGVGAALGTDTRRRSVILFTSPCPPRVPWSECSLKSSFEFQPTNPFATSCTSPSQVSYRFTHGVSGSNPQKVDAHLEVLLTKLRSSRRSVIVGPHGTGKSTLLHSFLPKLQRSFPKVAFQQLSNDPTIGFFKRIGERSRAGKRIRDAILELPPDGLLVVDGWEQLNWSSRWRIAKSAATRKLTLLTTSHRGLAGWTLLHETRESPELILALAGDLLNDSPHEIRKLVGGHLKNRNLSPSTNVRELWFEMYDVVEDADSQEVKYNG